MKTNDPRITSRPKDGYKCQVLSIISLVFDRKNSNFMKTMFDNNGHLSSDAEKMVNTVYCRVIGQDIKRAQGK